MGKMFNVLQPVGCVLTDVFYIQSFLFAGRNPDHVVLSGPPHLPWQKLKFLTGRKEFVTKNKVTYNSIDRFIAIGIHNV